MAKTLRVPKGFHPPCGSRDNQAQNWITTKAAKEKRSGSNTKAPPPPTKDEEFTSWNFSPPEDWTLQCCPCQPAAYQCPEKPHLQTKNSVTQRPIWPFQEKMHWRSDVERFLCLYPAPVQTIWRQKQWQWRSPVITLLWNRREIMKAENARWIWQRARWKINSISNEEAGPEEDGPLVMFQVGGRGTIRSMSNEKVSPEEDGPLGIFQGGGRGRWGQWLWGADLARGPSKKEDGLNCIVPRKISKACSPNWKPTLTSFVGWKHNYWSLQTALPYLRVLKDKGKNRIFLRKWWRNSPPPPSVAKVCYELFQTKKFASNKVCCQFKCFC